MYLSLSLALSLCIYIYIYISLSLYLCLPLSLYLSLSLLLQLLNHSFPLCLSLAVYIYIYSTLAGTAANLLLPHASGFAATTFNSKMADFFVFVGWQLTSLYCRKSATMHGAARPMPQQPRKVWLTCYARWMRCVRDRKVRTQCCVNRRTPQPHLSKVPTQPVLGGRERSIARGQKHVFSGPRNQLAGGASPTPKWL